MILQTPKNHFNEDIGRAKAVLSYMNGLPHGAVKNEVSRLAWMMAVGALDAYFCDAYGDLIARTLRAKQREPDINIKNRLENLLVPAMILIRSNPSDGWRWRMVARDIIQKDNVLSISKIKDLFNQFFKPNEKLFSSNATSVDRWILHRDNKFRLFGITRSSFRHTPVNKKNSVKATAVQHLEQRFEDIFQRRHDCIHNCDRPKFAVHNDHLNYTSVHKVIQDIEFLVSRVHEDLIRRFPVYLTELGFSSVTRNNVGC